MDAETAAFTAIALQGQERADLPKKLRGYSKSSIYRALNLLEEKNLVETNGKIVTVATNSEAQRLRRIHILAITHGIDPGRLLRESYLEVWGAIGGPVTLKELMEKTGFSYPTVREIVNFFRRSDLVDENRLKPLEVEKNSHPLNQALHSHLEEPIPPVELPYPGRLPSRRLAGTPETTESLLYDELERGISLGEKDWSWSYGTGEESIDIASVLQNLSQEEVFLDQLKTADGAQEFCLHMLVAWELDFDRLLDLSKKQDSVNQVGCWLDLVRRFAPDLVEKNTVEKFFQNRSEKARSFPETARAVGRELELEWVEQYEDRWNLRLRFSIAAFAQEVKNL